MTIGLAVLKGLVTRNQPFVRTPKTKRPYGPVEGLTAGRPGTLLLFLLVLALPI